MINLSELQPYKEVEVATIAGSASAAVQLPFSAPSTEMQTAVIEAVGDRITFNFGGSGVVASKTVTASLLPDGNFSLAAGAFMIISLHPSQNFVSTISGTGAATGIVKLCKKLG